MKGDAETDPKGLIHEAFRIDGITSQECRSIFLDWALSLPDTTETSAALQILIDRHGNGGAAASHPMIEVLQDGLKAAATPKRRGGWRSRQRN